MVHAPAPPITAILAARRRPTLEQVSLLIQDLLVSPADVRPYVFRNEQRSCGDRTKQTGCALVIHVTASRGFWPRQWAFSSHPIGPRHCGHIILAMCRSGRLRKTVQLGGWLRLGVWRLVGLVYHIYQSRSNIRPLSLSVTRIPALY